MSLALLILGLILFVSLVVVHEWGHFISARRGGVDVEEFGIGFPPRAFGKKMKSGFLFSINWLPIGGFVKLKGENDSATEEGSFGKASLKTKSKIMMAGVAMNLLAAFLILTVLAWLGMPKLIENQFSINSDTSILKNQVLIGYIEPDSPAEKAGLQKTDRIVKVDTYNIDTQEKLPEATKNLAGQTVVVQVERDGKTIEKTLQLRGTQEVEDSKGTDNPKGYMGISPTEYTTRRSTWSAPIVALGIMVQFTALTLQGIGTALGNLFVGQVSEASAGVTGPVGIFVLFKEGTILGYQFTLMLIAVISLTLAIINALPIPALDGGRLFVTWFYHLRGKKLTKKKEELIHGTGFALLMVLFVLITIVDIKRI